MCDRFTNDGWQLIVAKKGIWGTDLDPWYANLDGWYINLGITEADLGSWDTDL